MSQNKLTVVGNSAGLIVTEPRSEIVPKYKVLAENGVVEVFIENLFSIFLSNFGDHERKFPKGMVFNYGKNHPAIAQIDGQDGNDTYICLHIAGEASYIGTQEEEDEAPYDAPSAGKYWEKSVDLRHVDEENLKDRIMCMLRKDSNMWSGNLGKEPPPQNT